MRKMLVFLVSAVIMGGAQQLLTNGDFEQDLSVGWTMYSLVLDVDSITRSTGYESDPDYEVFVLKDQIYRGGMTHLYQTVNITNTDFLFSARAKMDAWHNNADASLWAAAAIIITYRDASGTELGSTRISNFTTHCPWVNSSTLHIIPVADTNWHNYSLSVYSELTTYLPGIDPAQVKSITVAALDTTAHTC